MVTQKQLLDVFRTSRFNVLSFENGLRHSSYDNLDLLTAFVEVARKTTLGYKVLILDPKRDETVEWEMNHNSRVSYIEARNWVITDHRIFKL